MSSKDWDSKDYREGWFDGRDKEKKKRPLWIFVGFCVRELLVFAIWLLAHGT